MDPSGGWETWGPPAVVLGVGVIIGLVVALRSRGEAPVDARAGARESLLAKKQTLLEEIRALEADRGRMPAAELDAQREALIARAARVLEELDALDAGPAAPTPVAGEGTRPAWGARAVWGVVVVGFFAILGYGLTEATRPRSGTMTGGAQTTGDVAQGGGAVASVPPRLAAARKAVADRPGDLAALNELTYEALLVRDFQTAMDTIDRARAIDPADVDVQVHLSILQISVGMFDRARPGLEAAMAARPEAGKPLLWMGLLQSQTGEEDAAKATLAATLDKGRRGDEAAFARALLDWLEAGPIAMAGAPEGGGEAGASTAASGEPRVTGRLALADGVVARPDQRVFLIVHRNEAGKGPPVAALNLSASELPLDFAVGDGDRMMKQMPWPEQVWIFARLDADGQAGASEGDVESGKLGPIASGTADLQLVIGGS